MVLKDEMAGIEEQVIRIEGNGSISSKISLTQPDNQIILNIFFYKWKFEFQFVNQNIEKII